MSIEYASLSLDVPIPGTSGRTPRRPKRTHPRSRRISSLGDREVEVSERVVSGPVRVAVTRPADLGPDPPTVQGVVDECRMEIGQVVGQVEELRDGDQRGRLLDSVGAVPDLQGVVDHLEHVIRADRDTRIGQREPGLRPGESGPSWLDGRWGGRDRGLHRSRASVDGHVRRRVRRRVDSGRNHWLARRERLVRARQPAEIDRPATAGDGLVELDRGDGRRLPRLHSERDGPHGLGGQRDEGQACGHGETAGAAIGAAHRSLQAMA